MFKKITINYQKMLKFIHTDKELYEFKQRVQI